MREKRKWIKGESEAIKVARTFGWEKKKQKQDN